MARGLRLTAPGRGWVALALWLASGSLLCLPAPATFLDWQPSLAATEPWRWWTAAFVHWSALHLGANLLGAFVVGALGLAARLPWPMTAAWAVAWPLTQLGWLLRPELAHFGGLSGVLHAGVAVATVHLLWAPWSPTRVVGLALALGLATKLVLEAPWGPVLRHPEGWDIAVAPWAHACGAVAGVGCALIARGLLDSISSTQGDEP